MHQDGNARLIGLDAAFRDQPVDCRGQTLLANPYRSPGTTRATALSRKRDWRGLFLLFVAVFINVPIAIDSVWLFHQDPLQSLSGFVVNGTLCPLLLWFGSRMLRAREVKVQ